MMKGSPCALCAAPGGEIVCGDCAAALPRLGHVCDRCALPSPRRECAACTLSPPPWFTCIAPFPFAFPVDRILHGFKYDGQVYWATWLARQIAGHIVARGAPLPQALVPVPAHPHRLRGRGYNQALELARGVGRLLDIPVVAATVDRLDAGFQQARLGADARRANVRGVFRPARRAPAPRHVAIIDDIVTTGATAESLARVLQRAGAEAMQLWVVARTLPPGSDVPP